MSNGINSPKEDIKKYDSSFLQDPKNPIVVRQEDAIIDSSAIDSIGFGYSAEELESQRLYQEEQERKSKIDYSMGNIEKASRSFVAGIGDLVEGMGDAIDYFSGSPESGLTKTDIASGISKDIYGLDVNKPISDYVHGLADKLQSVGDSVEELHSTQDVSFGDMFDLDFWSTHAARAIPFSLSFLIPGTLGAKGAAMAYRALSASSKITKGFRAGRALNKIGLVSTAERGSKLAQTASQFTGGMLAGNLSEGAIIAGQTYNDAVSMGLSEKQASVAAHDTYVDNAKWMFVDGLQLMGVLGLPKFFKGVLPVKMQKAIGINNIVKPGIKSFIKNMSMASGVYLTDGMLEQFQEVYQDWATKKNIAEQQGEKFMPYLDYFTSQEALPTRVIAFATSGIVSGGRSLINISAERKAAFDQKYIDGKKFLVAENADVLDQTTDEFELTKKDVGEEYTQGLSSTKRLEGMKENQLMSLLVFRALDGKLDYYQQLLEHHKEEGNISQQQFDDYMTTSKEVEKLIEDTPSYNLNRNEKARLVIAQQFINENNNKIEKNINELKKEIEKIEASDISQEIKDAEIQGINTRIQEVEQGNVPLVDEQQNVIKNDEGKEVTIREENIVHKREKDSIFIEARNRQEKERIQEEVIPAVETILNKEDNNESLTDSEQSIKEKEIETYNREKSIRVRQKAQEKVGKAFSFNPFIKKEDGSLVFDKKENKNNKTIITRKVVSSDGSVQTETITQDNIIKNAKEKAKEKEQADNSGKKDSKNNQEKSQEVEEEVEEDSYYNNQQEDTTRKQVVKKQQELDALRQEKLNGRVSLGDLKVWARNLEKDNPYTMVFFDETLKTELGYDAIGKAAGLSIFINPNLAEQEVFHHELWHVYQKTFYNTKEMQSLLKNIVKQPIFEKTKLKNLNYLRVRKGNKIVPLYNLVQDQNSVVISLEEYISNLGLEMNSISDTERQSYLSDMESVLENEGYTILQNSKQKEIKDEALAIAGGYQSTGDGAVFVQAKKQNNKVKDLFRNVWSKIKKSTNEETSSALLASQYPDFYNNDFAIMLRNFKNETAKGVNNKISWSVYKKMQAGYLSARSQKQSNAKAITEITNAIRENEEIKNIINSLKEKYDISEGTLLQASDMEEAVNESAEQFSNTSTDILIDVLATALNNAKGKPLVVDAIEKVYDNFPAIVEDKIKHYITSKVSNVLKNNPDLENIRFGRLIKEEYKRGVNDRVTAMLNGFVDSYNTKNKKNRISRSILQKEIDNLIDNNRFDLESFLEEANSVIERNNTFEEKLFKEFVDYSKSDLKSPGAGYNGVLNNIYQYFKGFRHENIFQFNISPDGQIFVEEKMPKNISMPNKRFLNYLSGKMKNDVSFAPRIMAFLVGARDNIGGEKSKYIANIFNKIILENQEVRLVQNNISELDVSSLKIDGMLVEDYFTTERLDEILNFFTDINFNEAFDLYAKKNQLKGEFTPQQKIENLIPLIEDSINNSQMGKVYKDDNPIKIAVIKKLKDRLNEYYTLSSEEQKVSRPIKLNNQDFIGREGLMPEVQRRKRSITINFFDLKINNVLTKLTDSLVYKADKRLALGQVQDPNNNLIGTYNKSSYLYDNIDITKDYFYNMQLEASSADIISYPKRLFDLFGFNFYAKGLFHASISPDNLLQYTKNKTPFIFEPEIGYMSGYYDGVLSKGFSSDNINPKTFTALKIMHIFNAIKNKQNTYKQFVGQAGDSGRQYFVNNASVLNVEQIASNINLINREANNILDQSVYNEKIISLYNKLVNDGYLKRNNSNFRLFKIAYMNNVINKYFLQDLLLNKKNVLNNNKFLTDHPKRFKGVTSPGIPMGNTRIVPIIIQDPEVDITIPLYNKENPIVYKNSPLADSESFILLEHQEFIQNTFGELNESGQNIKGLYFGQNLDNTSFEEAVGGKKRVPIYLKSHHKVLSDSFSNDKPVYRAINFVLKEITENLKGENAIPIVYFSSAIKGGLTNDDVNNISFNLSDIIKAGEDVVFLNKKIKEGSNKVDLIEQGSLQSLNELEQKIIKTYRFKNQQGGFSYGFDGRNYKVQTLLDNQNRTGVISKQEIAAYNIYETIKSFESGNFENGLQAIQPIKEALGKLLKLNYENNFQQKDFDTIFSENKGVLQTFIDRFVAEKFGSEYIGNEDIINNVVNSAFKNQVMSLKMQGTFSVEMSDIGFNASVDGENITYSDELKSYRVDDSGQTFFAEIIMPSYAKTMGVKEGDFVIARRIPHSKPGDSPVYQVKSFNDEQAGNVTIIPTSHAIAMGSDKDGDGLHISIRNNKKDLTDIESAQNEYFDSVVSLFREPEVHEVVMQPIDFAESFTNKGLNYIKDNLGIQLKDDAVDLYLDEEEMIQDRFLGNFIGIIASMNRTFNYFARGAKSDSTVMYVSKNNKPVRAGIKVQSAISNRQYSIDRISNFDADNNSLWLTYAKAANFIIDDTKFGNRAKFGIVKETANDFFLLLRMGVDLETIISLMYHPNYKSYIENKALGKSNKLAIIDAYKINPNSLTYPDLEKDSVVKIEKDKNISPESLYQLVETLSSFAKDIRGIQQLINLDQEVPSNLFSLITLEKQIEQILSKQKSFSLIIDNDPYLKAHKDIVFGGFKEEVKKRSLISEEEASEVVNALKNFVDLTNKETTNLLNNTLQFYKLALESSESIYNDKSYQSLYLSPLDMLEEAIMESYSSQISKGEIPVEYKMFSTEEYAFIKASELAKDMLVLEQTETGNIFAQAIKVNPVSTVKNYQNEKNQYLDKSFEVYRFNFDFNTFKNIESEEDLNNYKKAFEQLPEKLKEFFIGYEFYVNKFGLGTNQSLKSFFPNSVNNVLKNNSKKVAKNSKATSIVDFLNNSTFNDNSVIHEAYVGNEQFFDGQTMSAILLLELSGNFNPSVFRNVLQTYRNKKVEVGEFNGRLLLEKPKFKIKDKGVSEFDVNLYEQLPEEPAKISEKFSIKINNDFTELNVLKHFSQPLDLKTDTKKLKGGEMYLSRVNDLNEGQYGKERKENEEQYYRQTGLLNTNVSFLDFVEIPEYKEAYSAAKAKYERYLSDLVDSEVLRQDMLQTISVPRLYDKFDDDYFIKLNDKVSTIYKNSLKLDSLAKRNLISELYRRYSQATTQGQIKKWKSTEEGRKLFERIDYKQNQDRDLDIASTWFSPGDFGQYFPTLASVRRNLELENMRMHRDLRKVQKELNDAYVALFNSKYTLPRKLVEGISVTPIVNLIYSQTQIADNLFENLQTQRSYLKKNSKNKYEYVSETKLNEKFFTADNKVKLLVKGTNQKVSDVLSKEEYNYAKLIEKYTTFYSDLINSKISKNELSRNFKTRQYYTPIKTASLYETYKRRGIYGLYYKSLDKDYLFDNVFINAYNPVSRKQETLTYRDFKAIYSTSNEEIKKFIEENKYTNIDINDFNQVKRVKALKKARKDARAYYESGKDALGNTIVEDSGEMQAIDAEQSIMNRYISKRSRRASYFAGNNLHHAIYSYIKAMTFQFGTAYQSNDNIYKRLSFKVAEDELYGKNSVRSTIESLGKNSFLNLENSEQGGRNFEGFEKQKLMVHAAKFKMESENKKNSARYLQEVILDKFISKEPKKTFTRFERTERGLANFLTKWTMYVGLGFNIPAAKYNVLIGKYNSYRSQGGKDAMVGIARYFGVDNLTSGKFDHRAMKKASKMLDEFGILTYRPEEQLEGVSAETWFDKILFSPMVAAEKFIQASQFLGDLTQEEYDSYYLDKDDNLQIKDTANVLSADRLAAISRRIQNTQGRGYSDLDQRLIQVYALTNMTLQFKRWLPTYLTDRLGKGGYESYIDDFGNIYRGSIQSAVSNPKTLLGIESLGNQDTGTKEGIERFRRGAIGFALVAMLLLATADDDKKEEDMFIDLQRVIDDQALLLNPEDWKWLVTVPGFATLENMIMLFSEIIKGAIPGIDAGRYTRDAKYGAKGDLKATRRVASLLPTFARSLLERPQTRSEKSRQAKRSQQKRREKSTR